MPMPPCGDHVATVIERDIEHGHVVSTRPAVSEGRDYCTSKRRRVVTGMARANGKRRRLENVSVNGDIASAEDSPRGGYRLLCVG